MGLSDTKNTYLELNGTSGFMFPYRNKRIGKSIPINTTTMGDIGIEKGNHDDFPLFIYCKSCNCYMDFEIGPRDDLDGHWICSRCGSKVREVTPYNQLERENQEYLDEEEVSIPEGCLECGGPWPSCESSCSMYDN